LREYLLADFASPICLLSTTANSSINRHFRKEAWLFARPLFKDG
jgi:hypothetical protein